MLVRTSAHCRVTERYKLVVVGSKCCPSLFSGPVATDYHEASHEEGSVSLLGKVYTCVMVDLVVSVLTVIHEFFQLFAEKVNFTQI